MAVTYRYLAYDLRTLTLLGELPLSGVTYSQVLNGAGELAATMPLTAVRQTAPGVYSSKSAELIAATIPGRTVVCVERNGQLVDGYIIWTRRYDSKSQSVQLGGQSMWSYFRRRLIRSTTIFTGADQLLIARTLVTNAQSAAGGNINVTVGTETCGVTRDRTYNSFDVKFVSEAVEQLAAVDAGFDFMIDVAYVAGAPTFTFRPSYPRRGRDATSSQLVFESGRNITEYTYPEDATAQANSVTLLGAGDGNTMLVSLQADTSNIDAGWPLLEASFAYKDILNQSILDAWAVSTVAARSNPVVVPTFTMLANVDPVIGSWIVGDYALFVVGSNPDRADPRWSGRASSVQRIVGFAASPGDEGQETVAMVLGN